MTAKEYLKQAYLLDKQIQVEERNWNSFVRCVARLGMHLWRKDWYKSE